MNPIVAELAIALAKYYSDERLINHLLESDHEILREVGEQALTEEGYPDWIKLSDVDFIVHVTSSYSFEEWAELAKAIFDIQNMTEFAKNEVYEVYMDFIELFNIKIDFKTAPEEVT